MGNADSGKKLIFYHDGDCGLCRQWAIRLEKTARGRVECKTIQEASPRIVQAAGGLPPQRAVLEMFDGALRTGADAALTALTCRVPLLHRLHEIFRKIPGISVALEFFYQQIAQRRTSCKMTATHSQACILKNGGFAKDKRPHLR